MSALDRGQPVCSVPDPFGESILYLFAIPRQILNYEWFCEENKTRKTCYQISLLSGEQES